MNGALAIAEVLGIYGREGVDAAAYWRNPPLGSPGYFAFKMHGNYDGAGSRFGGRSCSCADADDPTRVSAFAALDEAAGALRVMLINKDPERARGLVPSTSPASRRRRPPVHARAPATIGRLSARRWTGRRTAHASPRHRSRSSSWNPCSSERCAAGEASLEQ